MKLYFSTYNKFFTLII